MKKKNNKPVPTKDRSVEIIAIIVIVIIALIGLYVGYSMFSETDEIQK